MLGPTILLATTLSGALPIVPPWTPVLEDEGIKVEKRELDGRIEFRGRGLVKAPLLAVAAVVRGSDRASEWMDNCAESGILEWTSATRWVAYNRTKSPAFFVSDRDVVLAHELVAYPERAMIEVRFHDVAWPKAPPRADAVRMPALNGHWRMRAVAPDLTEVEYQVYADPGGSIPDALVNWASERLPLHTLKGLRRQVDAPGYELHRHVLEAILEDLQRAIPLEG